MEAIEALAKLGTPEAAAGLLKRFTFHIDPSIRDQDEKEVAHRGVLAAGTGAIEPIQAFCVKAESLTWPLKILKELVDPERYVGELIRMLSAYDSEYTRNVEPKQQLIAELEQARDPRICGAVLPFLEDVNDQVRYTAVATVFAQQDPEAREALAKVLISDESVRIRNRVAEGFASTRWPLTGELADKVRSALPPGYVWMSDGTVKRA